MKKAKIIVALALAVCMIAALAVTSSADVLKEASFAAIKYDITETATAPVADGVISEGEYDADCIVLDGSGNNTEAGGWVGQWNIESATFHFTWDKTNLYVGVVIKGDTSASQEVPEGQGWFRAGDMFQIAFNPENKVGEYTPPMLNIGLTADAQPTVQRDCFGSATEAVAVFTDAVKGYSTKWSDGDVSYVCEVAIPWHDCVFVNGLGRESDGSPELNLSALEPVDDMTIGLWLVYANDNDGPNGTDGDTCLRTDQTTGCGWTASKMSTVAITLDALPEPTPEPTAEPTPEPTAEPEAEKKGCGSVVLSSAAVFAVVCAAAVVFTKKSK